LKFSCFSRFGFLRFAGGDVLPEPQVQYNNLVKQLGGAFDLTPGLPDSEDNEAEVFACAYHQARIAVTLRKAGFQRDVSKATDLLPLQEESFLVAPLPSDTIYTRQQRLVALRALNLGAAASNVRTVLTAALASGEFQFSKLRILSLGAGEAVADEPASNFQPTSTEGKWLQLTAPVGITGNAWASYGMLDTTIPASGFTPLALGDTVTVQGENNVLAEVVTVLGLRTTSAGVPQFLANFMQGHDQGATLVTSTFPRWTSTQAVLYVEVEPTGSYTAGTAIDPNTRAIVDGTMQKLCRGTCQWATVLPVSGDIGPFTVGITPLGQATIGTIAA
jgi:hypothetical protein